MSVLERNASQNFWCGVARGVLGLALVVALTGSADAQSVLTHPYTRAFTTDFTKHTVPLEEIVHGSPPKDGIPAIDSPRFVSIDEAERWLGNREPLAVVKVGGETKAYPLSILIRHEIVNDQVGGQPVTVTYCPLCNTTLAFDRRFRGQILDFGTTGWLRHSDLVMYDRQTETWWQQATGEGIIGEWAGEQLVFVPSPVLSWKDVKEQHGDALVLSRETGIYPASTYGGSPYAGYDTGSPWRQFFRLEPDNQLPAMERVVALQAPDEAWTVPFSELEEARVAQFEFDGKDVVVFWAPGTASAVDSQVMANGRDVGSSTVFEATVNGRKLTFEPMPVPGQDGRFQDRETGTIWNLSGQAVSGELAGTELVSVPHGNHFWFAWGVFRSDTKIWRR